MRTRLTPLILILSVLPVLGAPTCRGKIDGEVDVNVNVNLPELTETTPTVPGDTSTTLPTGDTGTAEVGDTSLLGTGDTGLATGDTGANMDTGSTGDTAPPCVLLDWYFDGDGDGVNGTELIVSDCLSPGVGWSNVVGTDCDDADPLAWTDMFWSADADLDGHADPDTLVSACGNPGGVYQVYDFVDDCDDTDPLVFPGAVEIEDNDRDDDCDGFADECATEGFSHLFATYVYPVGATDVVISAQRYEALGVSVRAMAPIVDGVDGWTVDMSVAGEVTVMDSACVPDTDWWYLSADFSGAGGNDCVGDADPSFTAYGSWEVWKDETPGVQTYVNNYKGPLGFPNGMGPGCELEVQGSP